MASQYLLVWLEGALQSYGVDSKYDNRDTLPFPSRSAFMGLLLCALGRPGEQEEWCTEMASRSLTIRAYPKIDARADADARARHEQHLLDFQMVGSGYDKSDPWQCMMVPKKRDGGNPAGNAPGKMIYRHYLQNMAFACILETCGDGPELESALQQPFWPVCLGRKNCPPSERLDWGLHDTEDEAIARADDLARSKNRIADFMVKEGEYPEEGRVMTLMDLPVHYGIFKRSRDRQVTVIQLC